MKRKKWNRKIKAKCLQELSYNRNDNDNDDEDDYDNYNLNMIWTILCDVVWKKRKPKGTEMKFEWKLKYLTINMYISNKNKCNEWMNGICLRKSFFLPSVLLIFSI